MDITVMENLPTEMLLYIFEMLSYRDRTIKEEVRRRKMRKFADNQTDRQANKHRTFLEMKH